MNSFLLCLYSVSLLLMLLIYQVKKKKVDAGSLLIFIYFIASFCSIIYYNDVFQKYSKGFYFFPLMYLFVMLIITLYPVMRFDTQKCHLVLPKRIIIEGFSWFFIVNTFVGSLLLEASVFDNLVLLMMDEKAGSEMYQRMLDNAATTGASISNFPSIISNAMYSMAVLLAFINLTYVKKKKILLFCVFFALLWGALRYASIGERGGLVNRMLQIVVTYFLMKDYLSENVNRIVKKIGVIIIVLLSLPMIALTISRFGESEDGASASVISYAGQSTVNFAEYAFDNNGIRYGDRTVSFFKRMLGFDGVPENFVQRRFKYPYLRINDESFSTYIGDFVLDFGPIIAAFIFVFTSLFIKLKTKCTAGGIYFYDFLFLHLFICIGVQGVSLFQYSDAGNLAIILYILFYWFLRFNNKTMYNFSIAKK